MINPGNEKSARTSCITDPTESVTSSVMIALKDEETTLMSQTVVSAIGMATHAQHLDESYGRSSYQAAVERVLCG
jgi:hypothetical protein